MQRQLDFTLSAWSSQQKQSENPDDSMSSLGNPITEIPA
jgi:hypothetical protein